MASASNAVPLSGAEIKPWSLKIGASFGERLKDLGIGAFIAATFIGSGDVAVGGTAGGFFGFGYWWAYWVTCAAAWFCLDVVARYYIVTGKTGFGMFTSIPKIGWILALFLAIFGVYFGVGNVNSQFAAAAWALTGLFPSLFSFEVAATLVAIFSIGLVWIGNYGWIEKIMSVMLVAIVACFFAAAIATGVNLGDAARGLIPAADPKGQFASNFQAIAGTNINGAAVLLFAYNLMERGKLPDKLEEKVRFLTFARANAWLGAFAACFTSFAILGVINQVIFPYGIVPRKVEDFAILIEPVAGPWAIPVFSLGVLAATVSTAIGNGMVGAYILAEYFGMQPETKNLQFRMIYIINALIAAVLVLARIDPIFLKTITSMMNATFFGVVGLVLAYWAGSKKLGYFSNGSSIPLWVLTVITVLVAGYVGVFNLGGYFGLKF